jgi:alkanesulfonate monooxygenase SsuD/methylene tetrahydromethanopterin reductase-like flavin-dependent oxidoreductase (luciferase family)
VRAVADPWVALAAIASATERLRLGPLVTPLPRRRVSKLARETATLDRLSAGRLTLGVGVGSEKTGELERFYEVTDLRERARLLDRGLDQLAAYWDGEFEPRPVQEPRIPVWVAARWPNRRPLRRAARWDGLFPIDLPGPDALAELADEVRALGAGSDGRFDLVVNDEAETDPESWAAAGATWLLRGFGLQPREADVRAAIAAGPG